MQTFYRFTASRTRRFSGNFCLRLQLAVKRNMLDKYVHEHLIQSQLYL